MTSDTKEHGEAVMEPNFNAEFFDLLAALRNWPKLPPAYVLKWIGGVCRDKWERGKEMQEEIGGDAIPFKTECENGAGWWDHITAGSWKEGQRPTPERPPHQGLIKELKSESRMGRKIGTGDGIGMAGGTCEGEMRNHLVSMARALDRAIAALEVQRPSITQEPRWIPWKPGDALPEVGRKYWCAIKRTSQEAPTYTPKTRWQDSDWSACDGGGSVLAYWSAPLPPPYSAALEAAAKVEPVSKIPRYHVTQTWSCGCGATSETDPRTFVDHTRLGHRAPPAERANSDAAKGKHDER